LEITETASATCNAVDNFWWGLKFGGTEAIAATGGTDDNVVAGKVKLYDGDTLLKESGISADVDGQVIFNFSSDEEIEIAYPGSKVLTLKADLSTYISAVEGSRIQFALGTSTAATDFASNYITAEGMSSGASLGANSVYDTSGATTTQLISNEMYIYATKPTVSLNASSPSGSQVGGSNSEVFRFDVTAPNTGLDISVNAIRFTLGSYANASTTIFNRTFKLYKSTDLTNEVGKAVSTAKATATDSTGWVVMYPDAALEVGSNSTVTYVLKGDTSAMDTNSATNQILKVSIEDGDFYWDDSLVGNARDKVLNLSVTGNTLNF
jgi:hypothetical protein